MTLTKKDELGVKSLTWVEEDGTQFLGRRGVLYGRDTCIAGRAVMIIHRNFEVPALKVELCGIDPEILTASPRNLKVIQDGW